MGQDRETRRQIRNSTSRGEELRTVTVSVRLTPEEAAKLDKYRGKIQKGNYLRLLLNGAIPPIIPELNWEAYKKLHKISAQLENAKGKEIEAFNSVVSDLRFALMGIVVKYEIENQ